MRLVLVHHPGQACTVLRELTPCEATALERHVHGGSGDPEWLAWLGALSRCGIWIACHCRGRSEPPPLLFVHRSARSHPVLMPMLDRPPHTARCPIGDAFARRTLNAGGSSHSALRKLLYRWFAAARLNMRFPYGADDATGVQYAALRDVSRSLPWAGHQSLYECSRTHPQGLPQLCRTLCRPHRAHRRGIFLAVTSSSAPERLREVLLPDAECREWLRGADLPLLEPPMNEDVSGPFVVMFQLQGCESGVMRIEQVMVQPVHSEHVLVPVETEGERRTLDVLLTLQQEMLVEHRQIVTIRKTLADTLTHERGTAVQVQPLGPNGRALHTIDVVCADATLAARWDLAVEAQSEPLYHAVDASLAPGSPADRRFMRRLVSLLAPAIPPVKAGRRAPETIDV